MIVRRPAMLALAVTSLFSVTQARAQGPDKAQCASAAEEAQPLRAAGKLLDARQRLLVCTNAACPRVIRHDCAAWLEKLDGEIPTIVVRAHDDRGRDLVDVRVTVDGKALLTQLDGKPLPIDPGKHALRYEADGLPPVDGTVLIAAGEKNRAMLVAFARPHAPADGEEAAARPAIAPPVQTASSVPVLGYALLGLGLVAAGSFTVFEVLGQNEYANLRDGCATMHSCSESAIDTSKTHLLVAGASLAVAAIALSAGGIIVLTSKRATTVATVGIGPGTAGATLHF
jgi:hypothetical protein